MARHDSHIEIKALHSKLAEHKSLAGFEESTVLETHNQESSSIHAILRNLREALGETTAESEELIASRPLMAAMGRQEHKMKAKDIMTPRVISIERDATIYEAACSCR